MSPEYVLLFYPPLLSSSPILLFYANPDLRMIGSAEPLKARFCGKERLSLGSLYESMAYPPPLGATYFMQIWI